VAWEEGEKVNMKLCLLDQEAERGWEWNEELSSNGRRFETA
jgi:hypothetical protein